jgi:hypothetical protein
MPFGTNGAVRRGSVPAPSTGEGGVGVSISPAATPRFSAHLNLPSPGGRGN